MVLLDYELNKNYIAKNLCVNRDKPMSGCNGKCYLKKQLAKTAREESALNKNPRNIKNPILFFAGATKIAATFSLKKIARHLFLPGNHLRYSNFLVLYFIRHGWYSIFFNFIYQVKIFKK